MMKRYLEIGPEKNSHTKRGRYSGEWWTIGRGGKTPVDQVVGDIETGIPQPDLTFDVVYSSHLLEHLWDPASHLRECFRVLDHGGTLRVSVPSAIWYCQRYLAAQMDLDDMVEQLRSYEPQLHKGGWDGEKLRKALTEAGFSEVKSQKPNQSYVEMMRANYFSVRPFRSDIVEGRKL